MRRPRSVNRPVQQQQRRPLLICRGIERHVAAGSTVAGSRICPGDGLRASQAAEFRAGGDVQRVDPLDVCVGCRILGHRHHKNGAVGSCRAVDHRRGSDSDLRYHLIATLPIPSRFSRTDHRRLPQLRSRVGIECIYRIVFRNHVHHVVRAAAYRQIGQIEGFGIH